MSEPFTTGPVSSRARRGLAQLRDRTYNFDLADREGHPPGHGWIIDDWCQPLPPEPPGPPVARGSWVTCRHLLTTYAFADPSIVRAVYYPDRPLQGRDMLLEGRFCGLRFRLGLRVGDVNDMTSQMRGRPVRQWGWSYRTLQGHLEMGQMDYAVWKWLDSGDVEFRIHAFSKPAHIPNPIVRFGFRLFGRAMQRKFARRALRRMDRLVRAHLLTIDRSGGPVRSRR